ncbi:MAG: SDR family NAD(P)-dependent oxidoreductase [Myxococcota bacterium]|nr:SDR family oxidoreductase [Myxococcales bacterium]
MTRAAKDARSVEGRVAFVTGAASGMGRATAALFAEVGARVAVTDVDGDAAERAAEAIRAAGGAARAWALDVADAEAIERVVRESAEALGGLDVLVNNAGVAIGAPLDADGFEAAWQRSLDVMLTAHARTTRAALPWLAASGEGRVVNVASTEALGATAGISPYTAAKHGVVGLTRSLAIELARHGITVNCVCPGSIVTGMTSVIPEAAREKFARRRVPLRRYGEPEEVAHMVLSLALPAASYTTGAVLAVDGGLTIQNT